MNNQEANANNQPTNAEPTLRSWTTPTFERVELKEALSSLNPGLTDFGICS